MADVSSFQYEGQTYVIWTAQESDGRKVKIARQSGSTYTILSQVNAPWLAAAPGLVTQLNTVLAKATALATAPANATTAQLQVRQADLMTAQNALRDAIQTNACVLLAGACFAAGTKLWTPEGYRPVEAIRPGELVYARDESDPDGPIVAKLVEEKFERSGRILHLHLPEGRLIRTTPEHPFFERAGGWTAAGTLEVGDTIRTDSGWTTVEDLLDTGEYERVYNLRVTDWHTYFVGEEDWGFSVWAHNDYAGVASVLAADPAIQPPSGYTRATLVDYLMDRRFINRQLGIRSGVQVPTPRGTRVMTEDEYRSALERVLRQNNLLGATARLAPETVTLALALAQQNGNRGRSPFRLVNLNDPNPYTAGTDPYNYYNRIQALVDGGHPEAVALRDLLPFGTRRQRYSGLRMQLWRTEYYAQQGLLRGVEVPVTGPNGPAGEVDILVAAAPSDTEGTRLIDTKYWTRATYSVVDFNRMLDQLESEVTRYLGADRVTASGQVIPNGYTLTLEFPGSVPIQFRPRVQELLQTYAGRLFLSENRGTPP
jgi:hypothetical protein